MSQNAVLIVKLLDIILAKEDSGTPLASGLTNTKTTVEGAVQEGRELTGDELRSLYFSVDEVHREMNVRNGTLERFPDEELAPQVTGTSKPGSPGGARTGMTTSLGGEALPGADPNKPTDEQGDQTQKGDLGDKKMGEKAKR